MATMTMTMTKTKPQVRTQRATFEREDERGSFIEVVSGGPWETVITGTMRRGAVMGNHYHKCTRMFFFVMDGEAWIDVVDVTTGTECTRRVAGGEGMYLEPNQAHAIRFGQESRFLLLKSRQYRENDADTYPFVVENKAARARGAESGDSGLTYFPL